MDARARRKRTHWRQKRAEKAQEQAAMRDQLLKTLYLQRASEGIRDDVLKEIVFCEGKQVAKSKKS